MIFNLKIYLLKPCQFGYMTSYVLIKSPIMGVGKNTFEDIWQILFKQYGNLVPRNAIPIQDTENLQRYKLMSTRHFNTLRTRSYVFQIANR